MSLVCKVFVSYFLEFAELFFLEDAHLISVLETFARLSLHTLSYFHPLIAVSCAECERELSALCESTRTVV